MSIFSQPITFIDIETTGGSHRNSSILEVAAFRVEDDRVVEEFHSLVNPGTAVPYFITNITGIRTEDVADAPAFEDIAGELRAIMSGSVFAAHNVRFDLSFVKHQLELCGDRFNPRLLCTVRLSRALYAGEKSHSLENIIRRHQLQVAARHRAYDDAKVLWEFCQLAHTEHGPELFAEAVKKQMKTQTLPPNLDAARVESLDNSPGVYIFEDEAGQPIYIGKSIKLRERVKSHFSDSTKVTKEMKISQQAHGLRVVKTAGEMEALLLESQMVKEMLPLYNQKLRRSRQQVILEKSMTPEGYVAIGPTTVNLAEMEDFSNVYGVYANRMKAKEALLRHQKTYGLCSKLLGLEKGKGACFNYHLGRCNGACVRKEEPERYNARVDDAVARSKLEGWPFESAVIISENGEKPAVTGILVDQWCVIGRVSFGKGGPVIESVKRLFDMDTYKILRSFVLRQPEKVSIMPYGGQGTA
ncbi:GIY-YIG nuclease family protein [Candidatus Saccharibacteria bacterium]|nr:GIY-YIG nuclease family protein [Candidatus Saccharibacteria bacterium]